MRRIETISGEGRLIGECTVAAVSYRVEVWQEEIKTRTMEGTGIIPGLKSTTVRLEFVDPRQAPSVTTEKLTLRLADGRQLAVIQQRAGEFIGTGAFY